MADACVSYGELEHLGTYAFMAPACWDGLTSPPG